MSNPLPAVPNPAAAFSTNILDVDEASEKFAENKMKFLNFMGMADSLTGDEDDTDVNEIYQTKLRAMIESKKRRLVLNLDDLRATDPQWAQDLMTKPIEAIPALHEGLLDCVEREEPGYTQRNGTTAGEDGGSTARRDAFKKKRFHIGFEGAFGAHHVTPRYLLTHFCQIPKWLTHFHLKTTDC